MEKNTFWKKTISIDKSTSKRMDKGGQIMGEIILTTEIPREKGFLYYTSTDKKGNLTICKAIMCRGRKKGVKK